MSSAGKCEIINIICEFLEVSIHQILYIRKLYPLAIFVPHRKYGIVVYKSEHPLLNAYITQIIKATQLHLKNNQCKQIIFCIHLDKVIIEKYIFDIIQFSDQLDDRDIALVALEQNFRTFILKLGNSLSDFKVLNSDAEFSILLHTTEYSAVAFNEEQENQEYAWIPVQVEDVTPYRILPLYTIDTDNLLLQVYIEKCVE